MGTIQKDGKDSLKVTSIILETEGITAKANKTTLEQFTCPTIIIPEGTRASNSSKTVKCRSIPYSYERIKQINVTMGNQGSDDDVFVDICSDVNDACCRTKLSGVFDDWEKNKNEIWEEKHLGKCDTQLYKVKSGLRFGLVTKERATNALVVNNILVSTENLQGRSTTFDCKSYTMTGKEFQQNTGGSFKSSPSRKRTTTKKPKATPSTRPPFRSG